MIENRIDRDRHYINPLNIKVLQVNGEFADIAYIGGSSERIPVNVLGSAFDGFVQCANGYKLNPLSIAYAIVGVNGAEISVTVDGGNTYVFRDLDSVNAIKANIKGLTVNLNDGRTYIINSTHITKVKSPYTESYISVRDTSTGEMRSIPADLRESQSESAACVSYVIIRSGQTLPIFTGTESQQVDAYCKVELAGANKADNE